MLKKKSKLVIDIGGTSIAYASYEKIKQKHHLLYKGKLKSVKGKAGLKVLIAGLINEANKNKKIKLNEIVIACPGNFNKDNSKLETGSGSQLAKYKGEFDGIDIVAFFTDICPENCKIKIINDAILQCYGGILQEKICSRHKMKFGMFLGIGTGLGGALFKIEKNQQVSFYSDGHISDIGIKKELINIERAEERLCGQYIKMKTGLNAKKINESKELFKQYKYIFEEIAENLSILIIGIKQRKFEKLKGKRKWTKTDYLQATNTELILLGGSIASEGKSAKLIMTTLSKELRKNNLSNIEIISIKDSKECALIGALHIDETNC
eukprot:COSAG01_NODE_14_length_41020_cov_40.702133_36_plen_323_part_00